jgi:hypothetical protein
VRRAAFFVMLSDGKSRVERRAAERRALAVGDDGQSWARTLRRSKGDGNLVIYNAGGAPIWAHTDVEARTTAAARP